jgi:hypothetical protein
VYQVPVPLASLRRKANESPTERFHFVPLSLQELIFDNSIEEDVRKVMLKAWKLEVEQEKEKLKSEKVILEGELGFLTEIITESFTQTAVGNDISPATYELLTIKDESRATNDERIAVMQARIAVSNERIATMNASITANDKLLAIKDERIATMQARIADKDESIARMEASHDRERSYLTELALGARGDLTNRGILERVLLLVDWERPPKVVLHHFNATKALQYIEEFMKGKCALCTMHYAPGNMHYCTMPHTQCTTHNTLYTMNSINQ